MEDRIGIQKIVILAGKNNRIAQKELFNVYHKEMLGLCIRIVGQTDVAEDLLQESFIKAFLELKKIKEPDKFKGWFKRIVINKCVSYIREFKHFEPIENVILEDSKEVEEDWYKSFTLDEINDEIDLLPQGCRQIFILYLLENYKHKEIAKMLNLSISTVKSQYQYALRILRKKLMSNHKL